MDFTAARRMMVQGQLRTNDVTEPRLVSAMLELPRERFVSERWLPLAYLDQDLSVSEPGQPLRHMLKPLVLAKLIHMAEVTATDKVLDVGCTTGYSSAVLSYLADTVTALEEDPAYIERADYALSNLGIDNVTTVQGRLADGWASRAPYDVILLNGAVEVEPQTLFGQLAEGGRLVCMFGRPPGGKGMLYRRDGGDVSGWPAFDSAARTLPGFEKPPAFVF
jgi:protein-L-isoaspartate(D-aspartate) O-methyltransferase